MSEHKTLVEVQHLQQYFPAGGVGKNRKYVQAVDDVSFAIRKGETLGLVGESGCGYWMMFFLAGLKGIDTSLYEAATMDGAGYFRRCDCNGEPSALLPESSPMKKALYDLMKELKL